MTRRLLFLCALLASVAPAFADSERLKIEVAGNGFLRFCRDGRTVLAKQATLRIERGSVVQQDGCPLVPSLNATGSGSLGVDSDGTVRLGTQTIGRLLLGQADGVGAIAGTDGLLTSASRPITGSPNENGFGSIRVLSQQIVLSQRAVATAAQPLTVRIGPKASVGGDRIRLGDIAALAGPVDETEKLRKIDLGLSPMVGGSRQVLASSIRTAIKFAGFPAERIRVDLPEAVTIERPGQAVEPDRFVHAATEKVRTAIGLTVELTPLTTLPAMTVPQGTLELRAGEPRTGNNQIVCEVAVWVDGKRFNSRTITLKAVVTAASLRVGAQVKIRVRANGAVLETTATVVKWNQLLGNAEVKTSDGAVLSTLR